DVDLGREVTEIAAEVRGSVRQPGPIQVQIQPFGPAKLAESAELIKRIAGSEFGHLSNLYDLCLRTVFVTSPGQPGPDQFRGELPIDLRARHALVPEIA